MAVIHKFEKAIAILNGVQLGASVKEIELPELEWELTEHEDISKIGMPQFPTKLKELECTITWADYNAELAAASADPFKAQTLQLRANMAEYGSGGKQGDGLLAISLTGRFVKNQMGSFDVEEMERESMMLCSAVREVWKGVEVFSADISIPSYRVGGTDLLAKLRSNLGVI